MDERRVVADGLLLSRLGAGVETIRCTRLNADSRAWTPLLYTVVVLGVVLVTLSIIYWINEGSMAGDRHIYNQYRSEAGQIIDYLTKPDGEGRARAYQRLSKLTDTFGPRMLGSEALEKSIDYLIGEMRSEGLENVHKEPVPGLPSWTRGREEATLLEPRRKKLNILGLGSTVPTPQEAHGITADVVVVESFEELREMGEEQVRGKIVVFDQPWRGYGRSAVYRTKGASEASKLGAVAVLIRSVTPYSLDSPHTGQQTYAEGVRKIPTACLTVEDAQMLHRMQDRNESIRIHLLITSRPSTSTITSYNTVAELVGTTYPNEVVLISGHLDSWDVGEGAVDDGGGMVIAWQALSTLKALNLRPKRTVRAVFWTAEEQGLLGSKYYYDQHKQRRSENASNETFVFVYESDAGAFKPYGLNFSGSPEAIEKMKMVMHLLAPIDAAKLIPSDGHMGDVEFWRRDGVPSANLQNDRKFDYYFQFHHTNGDTMDKLTVDDLDYSSALTAVVAYVVADLEKPLPRRTVNTKSNGTSSTDSGTSEGVNV